MFNENHNETDKTCRRQNLAGSCGIREEFTLIVVEVQVLEF